MNNLLNMFNIKYDDNLGLSGMTDESFCLLVEELFRKNVDAVKYENTIETAYPQTDVYDIVANHFKSELPEGKTEKKVVIIGYDGCRADILAEKSWIISLSSSYPNLQNIPIRYEEGRN